MPRCSWPAGTITPPELMSSPLLTGGDSGDGASCVGSRAGISPRGLPPASHPGPRNLLLDSGLSPRMGGRGHPEREPAQCPRPARVPVPWLRRWAPSPGPLLNCFCKEKCNFNIYIIYIYIKKIFYGVEEGACGHLTGSALPTHRDRPCLSCHGCWFLPAGSRDC